MIRKLPNRADLNQSFQLPGLITDDGKHGHCVRVQEFSHVGRHDNGAEEIDDQTGGGKVSYHWQLPSCILCCPLSRFAPRPGLVPLTFVRGSQECGGASHFMAAIFSPQEDPQKAT
jgi:hypothetical protein